MLPFIGRFPVNSQILAIKFPLKRSPRNYQPNAPLQGIISVIFQKRAQLGVRVTRKRWRRKEAPSASSPRWTSPKLAELVLGAPWGECPEAPSKSCPTFRHAIFRQY